MDIFMFDHSKVQTKYNFISIQNQTPFLKIEAFNRQLIVWYTQKNIMIKYINSWLR